MSSMKFGKVIDFDGDYGEIITNENFEKYFFLIKDVEGKISNDDLVQFQGKKILETNRAFFVKKYMINENKESTDIGVNIDTKSRTM